MWMLPHTQTLLFYMAHHARKGPAVGLVWSYAEQGISVWIVEGNMSIHGLKLSHIKTSSCFHCPFWSSEGFFSAAFSFLLFLAEAKEPSKTNPTSRRWSKFNNLSTSNTFVVSSATCWSLFTHFKGQFVRKARSRIERIPKHKRFSSICNPEEEIRVTES